MHILATYTVEAFDLQAFETIKHQTLRPHHDGSGPL